MNLKENLRELGSHRRSRKGFTLIELIVVIAILAVLAGVGTAAYTGYVEKANEAADRQLLNTINKAFASACLENGEDVRLLRTTPVLTLTTEKAVASVSLHDEAFQKYYAGNEDSRFKTDNKVYFDNGVGAFVLRGDNDRITVIYGGDYVNIKAEDVDNLDGSTFLDAETLGGVGGLLDKVDVVATFATGVNKDIYDDIINSPAYMKQFLVNLGEDEDEVASLGNLALKSRFKTKYEEMSAAMLDKMALENNWTDEQKNEYRAFADAKVKANMAVLHAAQNTNGLSDEEIEELLTTSTPKDVIKATMEDGNNLGQAALYYGMYVSYAHYSGQEDLIQDVDDPFTLLASNDNIDIDGFKAYLETDQGKDDLKAYKAAMNIISDSAASEGAVNRLVVNGFGDQELKDLVTSVVGQ